MSSWLIILMILYSSPISFASYHYSIRNNSHFLPNQPDNSRKMCRPASTDFSISASSFVSLGKIYNCQARSIIWITSTNVPLNCKLNIIFLKFQKNTCNIQIIGLEQVGQICSLSIPNSFHDKNQLNSTI